MVGQQPKNNPPRPPLTFSSLVTCCRVKSQWSQLFADGAAAYRKQSQGDGRGERSSQGICWVRDVGETPLSPPGTRWGGGEGFQRPQRLPRWHSARGAYFPIKIFRAGFAVAGESEEEGANLQPARGSAGARRAAGAEGGYPGGGLSPGSHGTRWRGWSSSILPQKWPLLPMRATRAPLSSGCGVILERVDLGVESFL